MLADLQGQIERITYTNEETGFTIAKVKVYGHRDLVAVVGNLMAPTPGEILKMRGEWINHAKYGEQFKIVHYKTAVPASEYGIQKYLGSGLIKGIGPVMAGRIVKRFGKETLDIIEKSIDRLSEIDGIGKKRIEMITKAWAEQKEIREVMIFLQSHGGQLRVCHQDSQTVWEHVHSGSQTESLSPGHRYFWDWICHGRQHCWETSICQRFRIEG